MTAILELGAVFGAAQSGFVADRYSRKKAIMIGCLWFLLGGAIQAGKGHRSIHGAGTILEPNSNFFFQAVTRTPPW
jgi:MFS family permease